MPHATHFNCIPEPFVSLIPLLLYMVYATVAVIALIVFKDIGTYTNIGVLKIPYISPRMLAQTMHSASTF